ncbi:hypothetical protein [Flexibacterium corallicola]|uniref:hypothetical protein n=1 Tax=Flexibacterium corallicola TaxID=3037259 RepID=UPI00286F75D5|nr:hypothetical protein [Pseudovibrio sp. M1P-2-3]
MKFAAAFLGRKIEEGVESHVAANIDMFLQSISPEVSAPSSLKNVAASNLCFGLPMKWALHEVGGNKQINAEIRERLSRFEQRLSGFAEIALSEDEQNNLVNFYISGLTLNNNRKELIEIETRISRLDQAQTGETR